MVYKAFNRTAETPETRVSAFPYFFRRFVSPQITKQPDQHDGVELTRFDFRIVGGPIIREDLLVVCNPFPIT
jgi:hypothetical protein